MPAVHGFPRIGLYFFSVAKQKPLRDVASERVEQDLLNNL